MYNLPRASPLGAAFQAVVASDRLILRSLWRGAPPHAGVGPAGSKPPQRVRPGVDPMIGRLTENMTGHRGEVD